MDVGRSDILFYLKKDSATTKSLDKKTFQKNSEKYFYVFTRL